MKKLLFIFILGFSISCSDDYLERTSPTQLAEGSFWKTESDATLAINGIYDALQSRVLYSGTLNVTNEAGIPQHDAFADNAFNNYRFEGPGNYVVGNADQSFGYFYNFWAALYRGIVRANTAIENIEKMRGKEISVEKEY